MKIIVITGSTHGIGYGLADSFLALECSVVINGRTPAAVEQAVAALSAKYGAERILGQPADVTQIDQVQALWDTTVARFGRVDIWINNAGVAHPQLDLWAHPPEQLKAVVETNVIGALYGAKVALTGMLAQGFGAFYNMEGLGSGGRYVPGLALYGSTKHALAYLTDALVKETRGTPVLVGALRPGMVVTNLLTKQYQGRPEEWARAKRIFNILADRVETVTPWLARQVLANTKTGARIAWLTRLKIIGRFLTTYIHPRDLFGEDT